MTAIKVIFALWLLSLLLGAAGLARKFVRPDEESDEDVMRHREFLAEMGMCKICGRPYTECEGCE